MALLLKGGLVFQNDSFVKADVLIDEQKIQAIGNLNEVNHDNLKIYDITGKYVVPGLIDVHVHYRDPGLTYKEDVHTGSLAAAHGGYTTVCAMANVNPVPNNAELMRKMITNNQANGVVHIKQYAPITKDLTSDDLIDYQEMQQLGICGFSNDGHGVQHAGTMLKAMQGIKKTHLPLAAHVEDDTLKFNGVMNAGENAEKLGLPGILDVCETAQLARDLVLAKQTKVHYHVCHVSTKESVELIRIAKQKGVNVTCEVAPHHLLLNDEMIVKDDAYYKMNPPLRTKADQAALVEGLLDGTIDLIATDHAPHADHEKCYGMNAAAFGITGSETAFATLYTKYVKNGVFSLQQLIKWMSIAPAKIFNFKDAGMLKVGDVADMAIFDLDTQFKFKDEDYFSKGKNTPFTNQELYGKTVMTLVNGKIAYYCKGEN